MTNCVAIHCHIHYSNSLTFWENTFSELDDDENDTTLVNLGAVKSSCDLDSLNNF